MEKKSSVTKTGYENDKQNGRSLRLFYNGGVRNFGVYFLCGVDEGSDQRLSFENFGVTSHALHDFCLPTLMVNADATLPNDLD